MLLNIVTLVTRPENLTKIRNSIEDAFNLVQDCKLTRRWLLLPDPRYCALGTVPDADIIRCHELSNLHPAKSWFGAGTLRNRALQFINDGWIYFLDDDNLMHPKFAFTLNYWLQRNRAGKKIIVFSQLNSDGSPRLTAAPQNMRLYHVDSAQAVFLASLIRSYRFRENCRTEDGLLIEHIHREHPDEFLFVDAPVSYFNALRATPPLPVFQRLTFNLKNIWRDTVL